MASPDDTDDENPTLQRVDHKHFRNQRLEQQREKYWDYLQSMRTEMTWPEDTDEENPTLLKAYDKIIKEQRRAEKQWREAFLEYNQGWREEEEKQSKEERQTEQCRNLQRAKTLASVTLSDLGKGCNPNPDIPCVLCEILFRAVQLSIPENELSLNGSMSWPSFKWYEPMWSIGGSLDTENQRQIEIFSREDDLAFRDCPLGTLVPKSSKSEQSIHQVRRWLRKCRCSSGYASLLPTRVLDLKDLTVIRLRESRGLYGRYACLSHCWGQLQANDSLVISWYSYKAHLEDGIRFGSLPKLFQDAVELAQALDIPYLWIDALCIVQGDDDDWREESAKMADVYRNSYLTFAATSARDSHGNCASQLPAHFEAQYIRNGVYSRQKIPHFGENCSNNVATRTPKQRLTRFPLLERGWVYQERLLAPRVLHLTAHEILWECAEGTICQCRDTKKAYSVTEGDPKVHHAMSLSFSGMDIEKRWRTVVEEYSSLSLTFEKDCLPALAGLAKQFYERRSDDDYLAGIWRQSLFGDMLWTAFPGPSERPHAWRSPTWSWASVQGSIRYRTNTEKEIITIPRLIDAHCDPLGPDSMGELRSGFVTIEGQVITTVPESIGTTQSRLSSASSQIQFCDYYPDLKESIQQDMVNGKLLQTTFCLRLARDPYAIPATEYFLVLRAVDPASNTYERVGLAECHNSEVLALLVNMYRVMEVKII